MINIYTSVKAAKQDGKSVILCNDTEFLSRIHYSMLDNTDKELMAKIDHAAYIEGEIIRTPFGSTTIYELSTGCKTVINLRHIIQDEVRVKSTVIRVTACGQNALEEAFKIADNTEAMLLLEHTDISNMLNADYVYNIAKSGVGSDIGDLMYAVGEGAKEE